MGEGWEGRERERKAMISVVVAAMPGPITLASSRFPRRRMAPFSLSRPAPSTRRPGSSAIHRSGPTLTTFPGRIVTEALIFPMITRIPSGEIHAAAITESSATDRAPAIALGSSSRQGFRPNDAHARGRLALAPRTPSYAPASMAAGGHDHAAAAAAPGNARLQEGDMERDIPKEANDTSARKTSGINVSWTP